MTDRERIEEAHGLWELAVARVAALVEAGARRKMLLEAVAIERTAFARWTRVSAIAVERPVPIYPIEATLTFDDFKRAPKGER